MNLLVDIDLLLFGISATLAVISSLLVVFHRSIVYSAFFLSMLGIANALLFSILGFPIIALFHLIVYVGAAVTFILFSLVMMREVPTVEPGLKVAAFSLLILTILVLSRIFLSVNAQPSFHLDYRELTSVLVERYWFALVIASFALVTTLIEAITLARREV
ncbi:MAG: NADH-quinone oxidoreductase subunit J [Candidatus Korarchaeum sp.]|nr:NADH-quinone oxidoreductase subunit J [Candidatus Korarchaeum sp.]MDW8034944.1 NADH-quinone oxidoreductase subunit J [Candidatus Korarchaeum sp.]